MRRYFLLICFAWITPLAWAESSAPQWSTQWSPVSEWRLDKYKQSGPSASKAVDLTKVTQTSASEQLVLAFDTSEYLYLNKANGTLSSENGAVVWTFEDSNIKVVRRIKNLESQGAYDFLIQVDFKGSPKAKTAYIGVRSSSFEGSDEKVDQQLLHFSAKESHRISSESIDPGKGGQKIAGPLKWVGSQSRYFILAAIANGNPASEGYFTPLSPKSGLLTMAYPITGNSLQIPLKIYFGPKELEKLRQVEPTLDHAVDFGWFTFLAYPLLQLMRWLYEYVHNYGIAIILLTVFIKIVTMPLNYKAAAGMAKMSKLQPQIKKLQERYKDDKVKLNEEMLALMRGSGANPMAGCFPILIQMPVFFALYRVLYGAVELYQAPFFGWIQDLSLKDPYYVTPILLTLTMFLQQRLTPAPATADPAQAKMMQAMPIIFGVMMLWLPSGLTAYMLTNAVVSIIQQKYINKKLGINPNPRAVTASA